MARRVETYEADDGTAFGTMGEAQAHDGLCAAVEAAMAGLRPPPAGKFGNDRLGYWPQDPAAVRAAKVRLCEIAASLGIGLFRQHLGRASDIHPHGLAGRVIDECAPEPLRRAWGRLQRIDGRGREWEQPYFALNPEKGCQRPYGRERA